MNRELIRKMYEGLREYYTGPLVLLSGDAAVLAYDLREFDGMVGAYDPFLPAGSLYVMTADDWRRCCEEADVV